MRFSSSLLGCASLMSRSHAKHFKSSILSAYKIHFLGCQPLRWDLLHSSRYIYTSHLEILRVAGAASSRSIYCICSFVNENYCPLQLTAAIFLARTFAIICSSAQSQWPPTPSHDDSSLSRSKSAMIQFYQSIWSVKHCQIGKFTSRAACIMLRCLFRTCLNEYSRDDW